MSYSYYNLIPTLTNLGVVIDNVKDTHEIRTSISSCHTMTWIYSLRSKADEKRSQFVDTLLSPAIMEILLLFLLALFLSPTLQVEYVGRTYAGR